jgi:hypothetical protein
MAKKTEKTGYKNPPKSGQFKKGQSGNRKGRPPGVKNFKTEVTEELSQNISIRENGTVKKVSKRLAMVKSELAKALQGDNKSFNSVVKLMERYIEEVDDTDEEEQPLSKTDAEILAAHNAKILAKAGVPAKQPRERSVRSSPEIIAKLKAKRKSNE